MCTDFDPKDHELMGDENAERRVTRITTSTIILKDTFSLHTAPIEKQKLVQLYPEQLSWTSTHLTGPNKYSQFLYKITAKNRSCSTLNFMALHIENCKETDNKLLAVRLRKEDSAAWKLLAKAMAKDLQKRT